MVEGQDVSLDGFFTWFDDRFEPKRLPDRVLSSMRLTYWELADRVG